MKVTLTREDINTINDSGLYYIWLAETEIEINKDNENKQNYWLNELEKTQELLKKLEND